MHDSHVGGRHKEWLKWAGISLLSSAIVIMGQGCSSPQLEPWHTEDLTAEFTVAQAETVRTFEDYRNLEDELFQELDDQQG